MDVGIGNQGIVQQGGQIHFACPGTGSGGTDFQQIRAANQLLYRAHAQLRHVFPKLLSHEAHEIHDVLRLAPEFLPKLRVLGADAHGAGVQVAHPHHHAAHGNQWAGSEAEFLGTQHGGDGHIPAAHKLAVRLNAHPGAQTVQNQALVSLGNAQLPG